MTVYARQPFKHDPLWVDAKKGDPFDDDDEMVLLAPHLFTPDPPKKKEP